MGSRKSRYSSPTAPIDHPGKAGIEGRKGRRNPNKIHLSPLSRSGSARLPGPASHTSILRAMSLAPAPQPPPPPRGRGRPPKQPPPPPPPTMESVDVLPPVESVDVLSPGTTPPLFVPAPPPLTMMREKIGEKRVVMPDSLRKELTKH